MRWKLEQILKKRGGRIILEDNTVVIINKPSGLLVLPDRYVAHKPNLYDLLQATYGSIYVVHRIDKDTSGLVVFAKTPEAHSKLNTAFEQRQVKKVYRAIVIGSPSAASGSIDSPIMENEHGLRKMRIDEQKGKEARTDFRVIEQFGGYSLVEIEPHTGRTHQIRVHMSSIGFPVLADPLYGDGLGFFLSNIKRNYQGRGEEHPLLGRTALHAFSLSLKHPSLDTKLAVEAPLPKDMEAVLKALRKYQKHG